MNNQAEVKALLSVNLKLFLNRSFGTDHMISKIIDRVILYLIFFLLMIFYMSKLYPMFSSSGSEYMLFNILFSIEMAIVTLISYIQIVNGSFLTNNYKGMMVYPIQVKNLYFSKVIFTLILNVFIAVLGYFYLLAYAGFAGLSFIFDIQLFLVNIGFTVLPAIYLNVICLTVFMVVALVKGKRGLGWNGIVFIIFDVLVGIGSYFLLRPHQSNVTGTGTLVISQYWDMPYALLYDSFLWVFILLSLFALYNIGGKVYSFIMKSITFESKDKKGLGMDVHKYDYRKRKQIISYIIRDYKLVLRVAALRMNCFLISILACLGATIALLLLRTQICRYIGNYGIYNVALLQVLISVLSFIGNFYGATAFSKEGSFMNNLKALPITKEKIVLLKYLQTLVMGIPALVCANIFIAILPFQKWNFIAFEVYALCYFFINAFIVIEEDINSKHQTWVKLEELFSITESLKVAKSMFIVNALSFVDIIFCDLGSAAGRIRFYIFMLFIPIAYAFVSFRRLKRNMRKWYD